MHALTMGHIDPDAVLDRNTVVREALDMRIVGRLFRDLGEADTEDRWRLGGCKVEFYDGYIAVPWLGGRTNCVAEEFALQLHRETSPKPVWKGIRLGPLRIVFIVVSPY